MNSPVALSGIQYMSNLRTKTLTGGSGDINPQFLSTSITQSASDTTTTAQITLPIDRIRRSGDMVGVVEVLKVFATLRAPSFVAAANSFAYGLTTKSFGTTTYHMNEPTCFAFGLTWQTFNTSGEVINNMPTMFDCTDGAGHGVLVATDSIFLQCRSTATNQANTIDVKILYRYKYVDVTEYVGIVQAQA